MRYPDALSGRGVRIGKNKKEGVRMLKEPIVTGEIYHVYNKSIADFEIFNNDSEYSRMVEEIKYYQTGKPPVNFCKAKEQNMLDFKEDISGENKSLVQIICYGVMPTHIHLALKQLQEKGISKFMNNILSSYSHYFNIKHNRKGHLWEGRFKKVLVQTDEQLLHLTRYIHLNPVTAGFVDNPADWKYSSYKEYLYKRANEGICAYEDVLDINPEQYKKFTEDRIAYQRELAKIKKLALD